MNKFFYNVDTAVPELVTVYDMNSQTAESYLNQARGGSIIPIVNDIEDDIHYVYWDKNRSAPGGASGAYVITNIRPEHGMQDYNIADEQRKPISERTWNKGKYKYQEKDPNDPGTYRMAAERFLTDCGLPLVPDAVDQLAEAFLPALQIICERGYHP